MNKILSFAIFFVVLATSVASAEAYKKHSFEIGSEIYYYDYKEPNLMENKGFMYGVLGSYAYHNKIMLSIDGRFAYGPVDYTSPVSGDMDNVGQKSRRFT